MPLSTWLLSALLIGPIGDNPSTVGQPSAHPRGPAGPAATYPGGVFPAVKPDAQTADPPARAAQSPAAPVRPTTAQLVGDALTLQPGSSIQGLSVALVSVVATAPDRQRQIDSVHAYWKLAEAVGQFRICFERQQRLARLQARADEATELRTARAVATAQLHEAELQVTTAQHDLAEILLLTPETPLPLPVDPPLVGAYRTMFAELFSGKKAPERARMLDQTLPLRNRAVESHAAALLAAEDALDAAVELQSSGQGRVAGVIAAMDSQVQQQRAFVSAVCRYNHDIADYALLAVPSQTTPEILVGTLIKQNRMAGKPATPLPTMATLPAAYQQPITSEVRNGGVPFAILGQPTRAARSGAAADRTPAPAVPVHAQEAVPAGAPVVVSPANPPQGNDPEEPRLAPPQESAIPLVPEKPADSTTPPTRIKSPGGPTTHSSQKPITENTSPQASALETYPGLVGLSSIDQATKLATVLYWDRNLPMAAGQTTSLTIGAVPKGAGSREQRTGDGPALRLIDCLRSVPADNRAAVVDAYWTARQASAQYQLLIEQIQWLESLGPTLSAQNPPSPTGMLTWRAARLASEAERADAEADWSLAQFKLAGLAGIDTSRSLPRPISVPFVGRLPLIASSAGAGALPAPGSKLQAPADGPLALRLAGVLPAPSSRPPAFPVVPPAPSHSWSQRRLEATIPQRQAAIADQATVVIESDASRAAATAEFLAGRSSLERVLATIDSQSRETSSFLQAVTAYNRAIAQYMTATLPRNTEAEKLVSALMVE